MEKISIAQEDKSFGKISEFICFTLSVFFSVLPVFCAISPDNNGMSFRIFSYILFAVLILSAVFYFVKFIYENGLTAVGVTFFAAAKKCVCTFRDNRHYSLLLLSFVLTVISAIFSKNTVRAFFGTEFRPDGIFMYTSCLLIFIAASFVKSKEYKKAIEVIYLVEFFLISLIMVQQYYGIIGTGFVRENGIIGNYLKSVYENMGIRTGHFYKGATGTFYNSNHMGYYSAMCSLIASGLFIQSKSLIGKISLCLFCVYSFWVVIINDTFGAYIAVGSSLIIISFVCVLRVKYYGLKKCAKVFIPLVLFITVSVSFSAFSTKKGDEPIVTRNIEKLSSDVSNIAKNKPEKYKSGTSRWKLWTETAKEIKKRPVLGYGPDNIKKIALDSGAKYDRAHNEILERAVSTGIPSAIFYFSGVYLLLLKRLKDKRFIFSASLVPLMAAIGYCISALTGVFLFYTAVHFFVMLGLTSSK